MALLDQCRPGRFGVLDSDDRANRYNVPVATGVVAWEVSTHRMRVGDGHSHLPYSVDQLHAHRHERGAIAIVQMKKIEFRSAALLDLKPETCIKRFFARPADPEEALP